MVEKSENNCEKNIEKRLGKVDAKYQFYRKQNHNFKRACDLCVSVALNSGFFVVEICDG